MLHLLPIAHATDDEPSIEVVVEDGAEDRVQGSAVTVIEIDERLSDAADLGQALEASAGASIVRLGGLGDWSGVSLRGSSFRQVQISLDGMPLNPDGSDAVNLSELPLHALARIEVYRGAAPPQLAAAPIGGVINLVTVDEVSPSVRLTGGSLGTLALSATGGSESLLLYAESFGSRGDYVHFNDNGTIYNLADDALRKRQNNEKAQLSTLVRWRHPLGSWELTALDAMLVRDEGLPGRLTAPSLHASLSTRRNLVALRAHRVGPSYGLELRGWDLRRYEHLVDLDDEIGVGRQDRESMTTSTGVLAHGAWAARSWLVPALTLGYRHDRYRVSDQVDELIEYGPAVRHSWTAVLSADLHLWEEHLTLSPVLQGQLLDNRSLGERPFDVGVVSPEVEPLLAELSPRATAVLRPVEGLVVRAGAGRYLRPPDFTELFGDRGGLIGNPDLVPERGLHADAGVRYTRGPVALEAGVFHVRSDKLIVLIQNSQYSMVPVNLDGALARGLELGADLSALDFLDLRVAWTLSDTTIQSADDSMAGNPLPGVPGTEFDLSGSVHHTELVRAGWSWSYSDRTTFDRTAFYWSAPRTFHNVFLRVQPVPALPSVELSVLNVADTIVEVVDRNPIDPQSGRAVQPVTDFSGYPLPGRTILLSITWSSP